MKILYLGDASEHSTSSHRANALRRLGHLVEQVNPREALPRAKWVGGLSVRIGYGIFQPLVMRYLKKNIKESHYDLIWVNCAAELGPQAYAYLSRLGKRIVNYQNDDPFGGRDGKKWQGYLKSLPYIDKLVVVRDVNIEEAYLLGAKEVQRVYMSYDSLVHARVEPTSEEKTNWASEVSFIGTWMPERGPFMARLVEMGVPLTIRGDWWQKAPEWPKLKQAWKGPAVYGRDYVLALQLSKVTLGMLSKGNRDLHTRRSAEIPFIGGAAFCAERTKEHEGMYAEGKEAEFWSTPDECAEKCFALLGDEKHRLQMVQAAKLRVEAAGLNNDAVMESILKQI